MNRRDALRAAIGAAAVAVLGAAGVKLATSDTGDQPPTPQHQKRTGWFPFADESWTEHDIRRVIREGVEDLERDTWARDVRITGYEIGPASELNHWYAEQFPQFADRLGLRVNAWAIPGNRPSTGLMA